MISNNVFIYLSLLLLKKFIFVKLYIINVITMNIIKSCMVCFISTVICCLCKPLQLVLTIQSLLRANPFSGQKRVKNVKVHGKFYYPRCEYQKSTCLHRPRGRPRLRSLVPSPCGGHPSSTVASTLCRSDISCSNTYSRLEGIQIKQ